MQKPVKTLLSADENGKIYTHKAHSRRNRQCQCFQNGVMEVCTDFVYYEGAIWIGDVLVFDTTFEDYISHLETSFQQIPREKSHAVVEDYRREGVTFDPAMIHVNTSNGLE